MERPRASGADASALRRCQGESPYFTVTVATGSPRRCVRGGAALTSRSALPYSGGPAEEWRRAIAITHGTWRPCLFAQPGSYPTL